MRYVIRPKGWYDCDYLDPTNPPSIQIEASEGHKTGLLDASGNEIWSQPDPIGFRFENNE